MSDIDKKVQAMLDANTDSQAAMLGDFTAEQLNAAHEAEAKAGNRSTTLGHVDRELKARRDAYTDVNAAAATAAKHAGVDHFTSEDERDVEHAKALNERDERHATALNDRDVAHADAIAAKDTEIADLNAKLAKVDKAPRSRTKEPTKPAARKLSMAGDRGLGEPAQVVFVGEDDMTLPDLPELAFGAFDFRFEGRGEARRAVLHKEIRIPEMPGRANVGAAFLVDDSGKALARTELLTPVTVGGGNETVFPAGSLAFDAPRQTRDAGAEPTVA